MGVRHSWTEDVLAVDGLLEVAIIYVSGGSMVVGISTFSVLSCVDEKRHWHFVPLFLIWMRMSIPRAYLIIAHMAHRSMQGSADVLVAVP